MVITLKEGGEGHGDLLTENWEGKGTEQENICSDDSYVHTRMLRT